jgi:hypothetical protein
MAEAYSHEVSSAGWWPGGSGRPPAFYAYHYPMPRGYADAAIPGGSTFDSGLGEFVLPWNVVQSAADPDQLILDFLECTFLAGATLADWDLAALISPAYPRRLPPRRAWSTDLPGSLPPAPHRTLPTLVTPDQTTSRRGISQLTEAERLPTGKDWP